MKNQQRRTTIFFTIMILLSAAGGCVLAETPKVQPSDLAIQVDFSRPAGVLKHLHGVNGGPRAVGRHSGDMVTLHKQAGFPSVRLHDCNWPHPDVVDIPAIFPLFHLDPDDPKNYQFARTDAYIKPIIENGASILYRMGVSIEHKSPRFHVAPPEDFEKWAKICVNILRHYNDGWANGHHYNIRHVEIWNEMESSLMWTGTDEQYFQLYRTAVTAIKKYNPKIMVGGPVTAIPDGPAVRPFLAYCRDNKVPLDFFSWHSYSNVTIEPLMTRIKTARSLLDEYGFHKTESWCTEWKPIISGWKRIRWRKNTPRHTVRDAFAENRNHEAAAFMASALLQMQDAPVDMAYYYCADDSPWSMFDVFGEPGRSYFSMKAFNQFLQAPNRVTVTGAPGKDEITVAAGLAKDGKMAMLLASNFRSGKNRLSIDLKNLPWKAKVKVTSWRTDKNKELAPEKAKQIDPKNPSLLLDLPSGTVLLVQLQPVEKFGETFNTVRVVLPKKPNDYLKRIVSVFARQVQQRCPAKITTKGKAPLTVALTVDPELGKEGFRITDRVGGGIEVAGYNELGVLYGLGKLLRTSRYSKDGFSPGSWRGESVPQKPIRGIYFATHFHNFYHDAPVEKIQRYVEDLALWGYNELLVWYDMHHFNGADDPKAVAFRARLRATLLAAKRVGMHVSLVVIGNEAYGNSPAEIRSALGGGRGGYYPCAVCPSKPEGMQYILKILGDEFDWASDLQPRSIWIWPYDQGGCGCSECQPWGSKGFMKCVKEVGRLARNKIPQAQIVLSSWFIRDNEWRGITDQLTQNKDLVDAIVSEPGPAGIVIDPKDLGLPLIGFPEISMHETFPWGGFGATPLTARARTQWNAVKATHAGGFPYSEGIYEDLTKVVYSQLYWNDRPVTETVKEYIAFEFSPDVVEDVTEVIKTLERNHHMRWWPDKLKGVKLAMNWFPSRGAKPQADPGAEDAYAMMKRVDKLLSSHARKSWRWRQLYLRALLDAELKANGGKPNDLCNKAFAELIEIYHAQNAEPHVRPPQVK